MSQPKYKYYWEVKKRILGYRPDRKPAGTIGFIYDYAIARAWEDLDKMANGEDRKKIVNYVLIHGGSVDAASIKYHYSCRSVSRIISHFMSLVIQYANT